MEKFNTIIEEIKVLGHELVGKVKELIDEGNINRLIIKDEHGHTLVEVPVTVAAIGAVIAPVLAAIAAIGAMAGKFTIVVEKVAPKETPATPHEEPATTV